MNSNTFRYYVYDYLINQHFLLIDTEQKQAYLYDTNIYGQIYNIKNPTIINIKDKLRGFLRRVKNGYNYATAYVLDKFLFNHFLTEEEQQRINKDYLFEIKPTILITCGNDFKSILKEMCLKAYDGEDRDITENSMHKTREQLLAYIKEI